MSDTRCVIDMQQQCHREGVTHSHYLGVCHVSSSVGAPEGARHLRPKRRLSLTIPYTGAGSGASEHGILPSEPVASRRTNLAPSVRHSRALARSVAAAVIVLLVGWWPR